MSYEYNPSTPAQEWNAPALGFHGSPEPGERRVWREGWIVIPGTPWAEWLPGKQGPAFLLPGKMLTAWLPSAICTFSICLCRTVCAVYTPTVNTFYAELTAHFTKLSMTSRTRCNGRRLTPANNDICHWGIPVRCHQAFIPRWLPQTPSPRLAQVLAGTQLICTMAPTTTSTYSRPLLAATACFLNLPHHSWHCSLSLVHPSW